MNEYLRVFNDPVISSCLGTISDYQHSVIQTFLHRGACREVHDTTTVKEGSTIDNMLQEWFHQYV